MSSKSLRLSAIQLTAWTLVYVTIAMELLFELCIAWIWYYYFRSYVERKQVRGIPEDRAENMPAAPTPPASRQVPVDPQTLALIVAATLEQLQQPIPPPPSPGNGQQEPVASQRNGSSLPIGYFTQAQRSIQMRQEDQGSTLKGKASVQACTDVYREEIDRYTVWHEYSRGGRVFRTPYTENQIQARINQYEREVEEALSKAMGEGILENRRQWLSYWQAKLEELRQKQSSAKVVK